jgi:hypothetical protein
MTVYVRCKHFCDVYYIWDLYLFSIYTLTEAALFTDAFRCKMLSSLLVHVILGKIFFIAGIKYKYMESVSVIALSITNMFSDVAWYNTDDIIYVLKLVFKNNSLC